jgi:hypothetical protein
MGRACSTHGRRRRRRRRRRKMHIGYRWESQKERDCYEDQDVGGWITLK